MVKSTLHDLLNLGRGIRLDQKKPQNESSQTTVMVIQNVKNIIKYNQSKQATIW